MAYAAVLVLCLILAAPAAAAPVRSIADAPTRAVETDRGQIGYRSFGRGERPPLVLIMGLSGTMDVWPPSFVDRLAARRLVITFDNRGVGRTEPGAGPLTISAMADDTAALIRALRLRRADVLGWSMGGMVAQSLARRHPQVMRHLVLCASAPGDGRATLPQADALAELSGGGVFGLLFPPGRAGLSRRFERDIARYPNVRRRAPQAVTQLQFGASAAWLTGGDPSGQGPKRLRRKVLIGAGALDRALPVANQRYLAGVLPNARLRVYAGAAHGFFFQHRHDFVRRVNRFLETP